MADRAIDTETRAPLRKAVRYDRLQLASLCGESMQVVLVILIVALIAKDISYFGDPYIMRGTAQALCLFVGGLWLALHFSASLLKRYWPVLGYLLILCLAIYGTRDPIYVTLQVASLAAIIIFGIAYFEVTKRCTGSRRGHNAHQHHHAHVWNCRLA